MTADPATLRHAVAQAAGAALTARASMLPGLNALVGFDGFVDHILDAVRLRRSMAMDDYHRISTIAEFADRVRTAAGVSTNIELVRRYARFGGNGPLLASGLAGLGVATTFIGCVGSTGRPGSLDPLFAPLAQFCRRVVPLGPPGHTDALEFDDGKVMFNQTAPVQRADWNALVAALGLPTLRQLVQDAGLIGVVNWSLCGGVESIWQGLIEHVLPGLPARADGSPRRVFIDLSDPAKRVDDDVRGALTLLARLNRLVPVTLGLNRSEAHRVGRVLGAELEPSLPIDRLTMNLARQIQAATGLDTVVVHPREGAGAATANGQTSWFLGPLARTPRLSTGAGDHFNAGFAAAQAIGLDLDSCLAVGTATSGCYVRDAASPTLARVASMLHDLPGPEID